MSQDSDARVRNKINQFGKKMKKNLEDWMFEEQILEEQMRELGEDINDEKIQKLRKEI